MRVRELKEFLRDLPDDAVVLTNACEATTLHECVEVVDTVGVEMGAVVTNVFIGSGPLRFE